MVEFQLYEIRNFFIWILLSLGIIVIENEKNRVVFVLFFVVWQFFFFICGDGLFSCSIFLGFRNIELKY